MPHEYHALYTPHPCLIQDQSASQTSRYCKLCGAMKSSNLLPKKAIEPCSPRQIARIFILLAVWVTLISCSGGSGGSSESATGSNAPTTDGSATGGQRNPVCVAGTSSGEVTIVATTTQTQSSAADGAQVFVFLSNGALYQPSGLSFPAWPRYNNRTGTGGDADRNGQGHSGYGCYGLNVAIGNIDDDDDLEIIVTYDNHEIQAFKLNGNGNGVPAAPAVYDLNGDGQLEIFVQTFDHGMDVFTVPGSACNCIPWPAARGGPLRMGQPNSNDL